MDLRDPGQDPLFESVGPALAEAGFELVDIELVEAAPKILRVTIDKGGGVGVKDCATASKKISLILDVEDPFPFEYHLEVSSPGIFRELKRPGDFVSFVGERVEARLKAPVNERKKITGLLKGADEARISLEAAGETLCIERDNLEKIRLYPQL